MADSLDDFFAKKDKKRSKDKGKATLSSKILGKELEEGSKQLDYPVRKEVKTSTAIELLGLDADDADWRDFEDIEKRDYTGLKVKEMSLQDQNDDDQRRLSADHTEVISESTPWKIKDDQQSSSQTASSATASAATTTTNNELISSNDAKQQSQSKITSDQVDSETSTANSANKTSETVASSADVPTSSATNKTDKKDQEEQSSASKGDAEKTGDKVSAKKAAYVPPQARLQQFDGEVKNLEPIKLGKSKLTNRGQELKLNIQDEKAFPSLG